MTELENLFDQLWPIYRSLTGEGNRKTLLELSKISKIESIEVKSGKKVLDWVVPPEYNVKSAFISDLTGTKILDFNVNNLHLVSYSEPIDKILTFDELEKHLHYIKDIPDAIPYATSYYEDYWGFCISYDQYLSLNRSEKYHVYIDASKNLNGSLTIGERFLPGQNKKEVLISTYICHPSMANNELSGPLLTVFLQRLIEQRTTRYYSYRFVYVPETIGAICLLDNLGEHFKNNLIAGLVVTCVGDSGIPTYKRSRRGNTLIDRLTEFKLSKEYKDYNIENYFPTGSDERQYCSPYFNLPVGSLMKTRYTKYKEYHTSKDNKSIMDFESLHLFIDFYDRLLKDLEFIHSYIRIDGRGEPFLRKYDLIKNVGAKKEIPNFSNIMLWSLNMSSENFDTLDIAIAAKASLEEVWRTCELLCEKGLLKKIH